MRRGKRRGGKRATPVMSALHPASSLRPHVQAGLGALEAGHHQHVAGDLRRTFQDSLDIDTHLQGGRDSEHRWDYLLGHGPSRAVIALEPHSAKSDQIDRVIRKKQAAQDQLRPHLAQGARVHLWIWVASGDVQFADTERAKLRLAQQGIRFVGKVLRPRHMEA